MGILDYYKDIELIGKGGFGEVYKGTNRVLNRTDAIKVIKGDPNDNPQVLLEAQVLSKLAHPNIVKVYNAAIEDDNLLVAMEFMEGGSLEQKLQANQLSQDKSIEIMRNILPALAHMHQYEFIHRDIKPSNILFNHEGVAKLSDFGLVKTVSTTDPNATKTNSSKGRKRSCVKISSSLRIGERYTPLRGTFAYWAPEKLLYPEQDSFQTDIWALGAVFYQMITGHHPYLTDKKPPSQIRQGIKPGLDEFVLTALTGDIKRRYQTPRQMLDLLENALVEEHQPEPKQSQVNQAIPDFLGPKPGLTFAAPTLKHFLSLGLTFFALGFGAGFGVGSGTFRDYNNESRDYDNKSELKKIEKKFFPAQDYTFAPSLIYEKNFEGKPALAFRINGAEHTFIFEYEFMRAKAFGALYIASGTAKQILSLDNGRPVAWGPVDEEKRKLVMNYLIETSDKNKDGKLSWWEEYHELIQRCINSHVEFNIDGKLRGEVRDGEPPLP